MVRVTMICDRCGREEVDPPKVWPRISFRRGYDDLLEITVCQDCEVAVRLFATSGANPGEGSSFSPATAGFLDA